MTPDKMDETAARLSWHGLTDKGRFRPNNEDAFLALTFNSNELSYLGKTGTASLAGGDFVFAVSDGMGGANAGEFASRIAVQKITQLLPKSFKLGALGVDRGFSEILYELFLRIHSEMAQMSFYYEECAGMGATLSLCWFSPGWMHFCHIGDSRIYYLPREGAMKLLTEDHTYIGEMLRKGRITDREARLHPERNVLQQVLGGKKELIEPQIGSVGFEPGDRFLICSDGVNEGVRDHRIETLLRTPPPRFAAMNPAERLLREAMEEASRDNITALVVDVEAGG